MKEENKILGNQEDKKGIERLLEQAGQDRVIEGVVKGEGKIIVPDKKIIVPSDIRYGDPVLCSFGDYYKVGFFDGVEEGFLFLSGDGRTPLKYPSVDSIEKLTEKSMHQVNKRSFNDIIKKYRHNIVEIRFRAGQKQIGFLVKIGEDFVDMSIGNMPTIKDPYFPISIKTDGAEVLIAYKNPKK